MSTSGQGSNPFDLQPEEDASTIKVARISTASEELPTAEEAVDLQIDSGSEDSFSKKFEKDQAPMSEEKDSDGPPDSSDEEAKAVELKGGDQPKNIMASLNEQMAGLGKLVGGPATGQLTEAFPGGDPDPDAPQFDVFDLMQKGTPIMKHGNFYNQFDFRMFKLSDDRSAIVWTKKSTMKKLRIEISKLHELVQGQQSKTFKKSPKPEVAELSWSIRYKYEKSGKTYVTTLDLICCRKFDREVWMAGLRALMEDPGRKELPLVVPEAVSEDATGQSMLKRSGAATAARYTGAVGTTVLIPIVGIPVLFWATYTHNRDPKKLCRRRLKMVKDLMGKIGKILVRIEVHNHPYTETAKEKYLYIGTLYEEALNIKEETEAKNQMRTAHAVQCLAEAQALYLYLKIESDEMKKAEKAKDKAEKKKKGGKKTTK